MVTQGAGQVQTSRPHQSTERVSHDDSWAALIQHPERSDSGSGPVPVCGTRGA